MASNLGLWWPVLKANLAATSGLDSLEDHPIGVEDWKASLVQPATRLCAGHLGLASGTTAEARHTGGGHREELDCVLTVALLQYQPTVADLAALRDALVAAAELDQTLGGYTDLVTYAGFEVSKQDGFGTVLTIKLTVTSYWEA